MPSSVITNNHPAEVKRRSLSGEKKLEDLLGEGNTDIERPLECGDRVKSIFRDRFGTVIRVQGGLVSTQWENGFTSTERREEIQLVLSALVGESQPQGELDDLPSDTDSGQLIPNL